jgi:hypothetical protein
VYINRSLENGIHNFKFCLGGISNDLSRVFEPSETIKVKSSTGEFTIYPVE